jgi:hypothetical protein
MKRIYLYSLVIFIAALILAAIVDFLLPAAGVRGATIWENWHLLFIALGSIGCLGLILIAKALAKYWLGRKEDYYD